MKIHHAVILAAGRGQRMMPLTETIPKPLAAFRDTTLVGHTIAQLKEHVKHIHVTVGYKAAQVASYLIEQGVSSVINTDGKPNAWWLFNTPLSLIPGPVMVLTCDHIARLPFKAIEDDFWMRPRSTCMLVPTAPVAGVEGDYIFCDERGLIRKLSRFDQAPTYASGIQVLRPKEVFAALGPDFNNRSFTDVWASLIERGQLAASNVVLDKWFSVDTMEDLERANREHP